MSRLSDAAFEWLQRNAPSGTTTGALWNGLQCDYPELTEPSEARKTPRNSLMRDMRYDATERFEVAKGLVRIRERSS